MVLFPSQYLVTFSFNFFLNIYIYFFFYIGNQRNMFLKMLVLNMLVPLNHMIGLILTRVPSIILIPPVDLKGKKCFWPWNMWYAPSFSKEHRLLLL
jgi:hypothetical protein